MMRVTEVLVLLLLLVGCSSPQDRACRKLSEKHVEKEQKYKDYAIIKWDSFYSKKYDACIHTEENIVGTDYFIGDLSRSLRKGHGWWLLNCDQKGADRILLDVVVNMSGDEQDNTPYSKYVDDGNGDIGRAYKTPSEPWSKQKCQKLYNEMIDKLKQ